MYQRIWIVTCEQFGFTYKVLVDATEERLRKYMSELPNARNYRGALEEEVKAARVLKMPIYLY